MYEVIFLWVLALAFIIFAVLQDIKSKEIANWINFSLVIFALGFRFFYSLFQNDNFSFFYNGLIGLGIFFILGNVLYYSKIFAGGDAKLMIALGAILPYKNILPNFQIFLDFFFIFLIVGFCYILISSIILCARHFKKFRKEFARQFKSNKILMIASISLGIILLLLGFVEGLFAVVGLLIFLTSYLYLYSKTVDESCMVVKIRSKELREGDWLYSNVRIGKKTIYAKWEGLSKNEIREIKKKYKEIKIRQGVPFSPVFLISFLIFSILELLSIRLWNPFW